MTELEMMVRVRADGSGLVGQLRPAKAEIADVAKAERDAAAGARELRTESAAAARSLDQVGNAARAEKQELDALARAKARTMNATRMLGVQVNDFGTQVASGSSVAQAFSANIGQLGFAMADMGGRMAVVGRFLQGPWGAAVALASMAAGALIGELLGAEKQAKKTGEATDYFKMTSEELTKAINDNNKALGRAIATGREAELQSLANAEAAFNAARQRRQEAVDTLELAKAQALLNKERIGVAAGDPRIAGPLRAENAALETRLESLEAELSAARARERAAGSGILVARVPLLRRAANEVNDPSAKIQGEYDRAVERATQALRDRIARGVPQAKAEADYQRVLVAAAQARDAASKALQERAAADRKAAREAERAPRLAPVTTAEVSAILKREFGGSITDTVRPRNASYGAKNSYHKVGQAVDFVPRGGMGAISKEQIRQVLLREGIDVRELLGPGDKGHGDHFHAAFSRSRLAPDRVAAIGARETAKETREAAQALRELESDLTSLTRQLDPAKAAADAFAETLEKITKLEKAGKLSPSLANDYRFAARAAEGERQRKERDAAEAAGFKRLAEAAAESGMRTFDQIMDEISEDFNADLRKGMEEAGRFGGEAFERAGIEAANAIAAAIGGRTGNVFGDIMGVLTGLQTGNFGGVGGKLGGIINLLGGSGDPSDPMTKSFTKALAPLRTTIDRTLGKLGTSLQGLSKAVPYVGAVIAGSQALNGLLGIKDRSGGLLGPVGALALNAILGAKKGTATITGVDSAIATAGNSGKYKTTVSGLAGNVQGALSQIADALGGTVGGFGVSIGMRNGSFRVDPSGRGMTKKKNGAVDFGKDEAAATAYALMDAIKDGAVQGLSAAMQKALTSSSDIDKAVREALKVREVEDYIGGIGSALERGFRDFEKQAAERSRIARQYGFDLVKLEEQNGRDRAKMFEEVLGSRIGALKNLLDDLNFGDLFEGSLSDQREKLLVEIAKAETDAKAGVAGAADTVAELRRRLLAVSEDAFGTAGGELAADRASSRSAAEEIIKLENDRVKAAQDAAIGANQKLDQNNKLTNETNDILAEHTNLLRKIAEGGGSGGGGSGGALDFETGRTVSLA